MFNSEHPSGKERAVSTISDSWVLDTRSQVAEQIASIEGDRNNFDVSINMTTRRDGRYYLTINYTRSN